MSADCMVDGRKTTHVFASHSKGAGDDGTPKLLALAPTALTIELVLEATTSTIAFEDKR